MTRAWSGKALPALEPAGSNLRAGGRLLLFGAVFLAGCVGAQAVVGPDGEQYEAEGPEFAEGRLLVKVTPSVAEQMERAGGQWGEPFSPDHLPVESLRRASERHGVQSWRRLIPTAASDDASGLARVYLLLLDPEADLIAAVQEFSGLSGQVEYAEPDYIAHAQDRAGL